MENFIIKPYSQGGEKKIKYNLLFFKTTREQKYEIGETVFFHFFISQLRRTNNPILPMTASAAMVFLHHHGSKINVTYLENFNEKKAPLGEI